MEEEGNTMKYEYQFIKAEGDTGQRLMAVEIPNENDGWSLVKETVHFANGRPTVLHTWRRRVLAADPNGRKR